MWANSLIKTLKSKIDELIEEFSYVRNRKKMSDYLIIRAERGAVRYYLKNEQTRTEKYIRQTDVKSLGKYAQERYFRKLEQELPLQIKRLERIADRLGKIKDCQVLYEELPDSIRKYVDPMLNRQKELIDNFYTQGRFAPRSSMAKSENYETDRGDIVRSKSELIIANFLFHAGIPYDYERGIRLKERTRYPDFTVLNVRTGKVFYWEHFGMMDDEDYRNNAYSKIEEYQDSGFFQGEKLITTIETKEKTLSIKHIRSLVEHYLK